MKTDHEWRGWFLGYFRDQNPWAPSDESKREWIDVGWEIAALLAIIGFFWLFATWPR